jgi:hypothetical protein
MRRPFEHTLTPADRLVISKWLLGMSALYGTLALVVVGFVTASHYRVIATSNETAAVLSATSNDRGCPNSGQTVNPSTSPDIETGHD